MKNWFLLEIPAGVFPLDIPPIMSYHKKSGQAKLSAERGNDMIHKDMTVGEVLRSCSEEALEDVVRVFNNMGMHCLFCPHSTAETLEQAAMVHGNDVDVLVEQLNEVYLEK
jgi:hybrid cluster-associated redox disulfide protein